MSRKSSYGSARVASLIASAERRETERTEAAATDVAEGDIITQAEVVLLQARLARAKEIKSRYPHTATIHQQAIEVILCLGRQLRQLGLEVA
jgi:hypothetical protein